MTLKLIVIIILGTFLRLYQLGQIPNSYTPDEVAQGYTAYSILKTGQDEWGSSHLLKLRSFGDFKPSLQTLLMIPSIYFLGLTPLAIRLPNALLSILVIPLTYLLARKLFKNNQLSLLSAFFIAISPFAFPLSRLALEANLLTLVTLLAVVLFVAKHHYLSLVFFTLTLITYHSAKIFSPLTLLLLIYFFRQKFHLFLIFTLLYFFVALATASPRATDIAIFNPTDSWTAVSTARFQTTRSGLPDSVSRLFNNKLSYLFNLSVHNYLSYLSPQFLATQGAGETTYGMLPGHGVLGLIPSLGLLFAVYLYFKKPNPSSALLVALILITPLAAAISKGSYSANRLSIFTPYLQIFAASGLFLIKFPKPLKFLLVLLFVFETSYFFQRYFFQGNQILAHGLLYGHQQAVNYLQQFPDSQIIYSRRLSEPQAYVMFFNQINPQIVQQQSTSWLKYQQQNLKFLDQLGEYQLKNYLFKEINFASDSLLPNTILVGRPEEFPGSIQPNKIIYYPDFNRLDPAIFIYQSK